MKSLARALTVRLTTLVVLGGIVVAGVAAVGVVELSSTNEFCYLCHFDARFQEPWRASAHYKEGVHCKDCHFGPGVLGLADAKWLGARDAVLAFTTTDDFNNREIFTHAQEEKCKACHNAYKKANVVAGTDLPPALAAKVDSVAYSHERHEDMRDVCRRCHAPGLYYQVREYATCDSCHAGVVHKADPKYETPFPRADRCSMCHTGRVHVWGARAAGLKDGGVFFFNDCPANTAAVAGGVVGATANCARCHPAVGAAAFAPDAAVQPLLAAAETPE